MKAKYFFLLGECHQQLLQKQKAVEHKRKQKSAGMPKGSMLDPTSVEPLLRPSTERSQ